MAAPGLLVGRPPPLATRSRSRLLLLLALVALLLGAAPAATPPAAPVDADGVRGIVRRMLGKEKGEAFLARVRFETLEKDGNDDAFELASPPPPPSPPSADDGVVITIRGSSPVALATGLGWYLRHHCKAFPAAWDNRPVNGQPTGQQLESVDPKRLPRVDPPERRASAVRWRYYMNVCTASYSMVWWDWARWEAELDWLALSGVNLVLAPTGQELVWTQLFEVYGVPREELTRGWFTGPAFAAWQRMGNIQKWGGPLSWDGFIKPQHELQLRILARMRELGITPVLPAFAGFLPPALVPLLPANASVTRLPDWNGFERYDDQSGVFLLEPTDPLFAELGRRFLELQRAAYSSIAPPDTDGGGAVTHMYSADTYNEMDPKTDDPAYLKRASAGVLAGMRAADPAAVWVMQGWLFLSAFWEAPGAIDAYLSGATEGGDDKDKDKGGGGVLVLDLSANRRPVWPQLVASNASFAWCLLHNYGGRRALYGNLPAVAAQPGRDRAQARGLMQGMGLTMEAVEHNPIVFEMMLEMPWRLGSEDDGDATAGPVLDVHAWAREYAERRYGLGLGLAGGDGDDGGSAARRAVGRAWELLVDGVYSIGEEASYSLLSPIVREPRFGLECERLTDVGALAEAWGLLVEAAATGMPNATAVGALPLGYDLVDVSRQALADAFVEALDDFDAAFEAAMQPRTGNSSSSSSSGSTLRDRPPPQLRGAGVSAWRRRQGRVFPDPCPLAHANATAATTTTTGASGDEPPPPNRLRCLGARLLEIIDDTEAILASNPNFLLGHWIADARSWGATADEQDLLEFNARNQVTLWGPAGNINDYASKQWAGLVKDYHRVRWAMFVAQAEATVADPAAIDFDQEGFHAAVIAFGQAFARVTQRQVAYATEPVGDTVAIARRLHRKYTGAGAGTGG